MPSWLSFTTVRRGLLRRSAALTCGLPTRSTATTHAPLTRLAPSTRVPGATGVFATAHIKKHTPLEILPSCVSAASPSSSPPSPTVEAPPFVCNLVDTPQHTICLRRFLALRAQFSDRAGRFLHAATPRGWFLLLPARAVPLPDPVGLQRWRARHHHRYLDLKRMRAVAQRLTTPTAMAPGARRSTWDRQTHSLAALRRRKARELAGHTDVWMRRRAAEETDEEGLGGDKVSASSSELTRGELEAVRRDIQAERQRQAEADRAGGVNLGEGEGAEEAEEPFEDRASRDTAEVGDTEEPSGGDGEGRADAEEVLEIPLGPPILKHAPLTIAEEHVFEMNDGVLWQLPPQDDLADPQYWRHHRQRMALYEGTGGFSVEDRDAFLTAKAQEARAAAHQWGSPSAVTESEAYRRGAQLFDALTRKANVAIDVDDESGLVTVKPLVDLHPGDELLLHYGREWWTERLLSPLFLNATDAELKDIRWIEALFAEPTDRSQPFPLLSPAHKVRKASRRMAKRSAAAHPTASTTSGDEVASRPAPLVLFNAVSRKEATDAEVLVTAVRLSCTSGAFLSLLLSEPSPVFDPADADGELPMKRLRRAVLHALRGYPRDGSYRQPPLNLSRDALGKEEVKVPIEGDGEELEEDGVFKI